MDFSAAAHLVRAAMDRLNKAKLAEDEAIADMIALGSQGEPTIEAIDAAMQKANLAIHETVEAKTALQALFLSKRKDA